MKKIYDVNQLLKPVRLYEQDSDATEAEDVNEENNKVDKNGGQEKKDENDQKNDGKNKNDEPPSDRQSEQNAKDNNTDTQKQDKTEQDKKNQADVQAQQNALSKINKSLMDCSVELDNIYKNNNLKKYGMGVENAYKGVMRFIWPAIGITVAITVAYLCMSGIIPAKKVLSKVPLIGKLFQGDKAAINSVQQSLLYTGTNKATQLGTQAINKIGNNSKQAQTVGNSTVAPEDTTQPATEPSDGQASSTDTENVNGQNNETAPEGSNPDQLTDKAPTIENSVEAQANAKPGDVIQRKNGEKYVLNQGDIDWAKQQVQKGKGTETVDQAEQEEDTGNTPIPNAQNETAPTTNQQNNNGQTATPANGNAQQTPDQNVDANNTAPQANNQSDNNGQANANQQTDGQQSESIKDVAQQTANVANSNTNQPTNNAPTSNSTTVKNPDGSTTTTTQNNNGQGSTGTTTTTTNGNTTTTTNVERQAGGTYAGQKAPLTEEQAKQVCQNNGLPPQYSYLITQNNCDQRQAIEAISLASVAANKLKSGKSSLDFEKEFGRQQLAQYGANCGNAFVQILQQMERNI